MALQIQLASGDATSALCDVLIVSVCQGAVAAHPAVVAADKAFGGALLEHVKAVEFEGKLDQALELAPLGRLKAKKLVLLGVGKKEDLDSARLRATLAAGVRSQSGANTPTLHLALPEAYFDLRCGGEAVA